MSMSRLWVRISNCSRLLRSMCGDRSTVYRSMRVGSGIGPCTSARVSLRGLHDLGRGAVEHLVVVPFHPDADAFAGRTGHKTTP